MTVGAELRKKRHQPGHPFPNRFAPGYFRHPEPAKTRTRQRGKSTIEGGAPMSSTEDVIVYAVRLGYKVAEEQVRRSTEATRRLRKASIASGSGDVGEVLAHGLRAYRQVAELLVEAAETLGEGSHIWSLLFSKYRDKAKPSVRSVPSQDLNSSLGRIADSLAGKVSHTLDKSTDGKDAKAMIERLAAQFGPALSTLARNRNPDTGPTSPAEDAKPRTIVFVDAPPGLSAAATLDLLHDPDTELLCDGLVGTPGMLQPKVEFARQSSGWEATVSVMKPAQPGTYRGVVYSGTMAVGILEVVLKRGGKKGRGATGTGPA